MLVEITLKVFEIFQVFDSLYQTQLFCHLVFPFCAQYPVKKKLSVRNFPRCLRSCQVLPFLQADLLLPLRISKKHFKLK